MRHSVQFDEKHNAAIRQEIADRLTYLLKKEASQAPWTHRIREKVGLIIRFQEMEQETTDPLAVRLLQDIISDMEADLKEQVDRLVAERH